MATVTKTRRRVVVDQRALAQAIGTRIRAARLRAGLTQQELAGDRYTKAYISALELGHAKPSMAALDYLAPRLGTTPDRILANPATAWTRLEADVAMAADDLEAARVAYEGLLDVTTDASQLAEIELGLAETLCRLGRASEAVRPAEDARRRFVAAGRGQEADRAGYWLSSAHMQMDDVAEGRRMLRELHDRMDVESDPDFALRVRIGLGMAEAAMGDHQLALAYLEEAAEGSSGLDLRRRGIFHFAVAKSRANVGDFEGAIRAGNEALAVLRAAEAGRDQARVEGELAMVYLRLGDHKRALGLVRDARVLLQQSHEISGLADLADTEAQILLDMGDAEAALALTDEARERGEASKNHKALFDGLVTRGRALEALGRSDEALATYEAAAKLVETGSGSAGRRRKVYGAWADALAAAGRHADAYTVAKRALG